MATASIKNSNIKTQDRFCCLPKRSNQGEAETTHSLFGNVEGKSSQKRKYPLKIRQKVNTYFCMGHLARTLAENAQTPCQRQDDRPPGGARSHLQPRRPGAEGPGPLLHHVKETLVNTNACNAWVKTPPTSSSSRSEAAASSRSQRPSRHTTHLLQHRHVGVHRLQAGEHATPDLDQQTGRHGRRRRRVLARPVADRVEHKMRRAGDDRVAAVRGHRVRRRVFDDADRMPQGAPDGLVLVQW